MKNSALVGPYQMRQRLKRIALAIALVFVVGAIVSEYIYGVWTSAWASIGINHGQLLIDLGRPDRVYGFGWVKGAIPGRPVLYFRFERALVGPGYLEIPLALVAYAFTIAAMWLVPPAMTSGFCICGYNITGNTSGVCPECGSRTVVEARFRAGGMPSAQP